MIANTYIDFSDDNIGYEQLAQALDTLDVDWTYYRDNGCQGLCSVVEDENTEQKPQLAFEFPASQVMENGEPTIKFGVYAGIYEGMKKTLFSIRDQLKSNTMEVLTLAISGGNILFVIGEA